MVKPISLGQLVESTTGRDIHKLYLVIKIQGNDIYVADGRCRSAERPKKKNIRHVRVYKRISGCIADRLQRGQAPTDEEIRGALKSMQAR